MALAAGALSFGLATPASAADIKLAPYRFEVSPTLGLNLPNDMWGANILKIVGVRGAWSFVAGSAVEAGALYQVDGSDKGYTFDLAYRYEMTSDLIDAFFIVGWHYTHFSFTPNYDEAGNCDPAAALNNTTGECRTDSGVHRGFLIGAGIQTPLTPKMPLKFSMKFYKKNPDLMLLLELAVGLRF